MMDLQEVFDTDRARFDEDLANLINAAAGTSATSASAVSVLTNPTSPASDPRLQKHSASQLSTSKRVELEPENSQVHPSRLKLLQQPPSGPSRGFSHKPPPTSKLQYPGTSGRYRTGSIRAPLGRGNSSLTRSAVQRQRNEDERLDDDRLLKKRRCELPVNMDRYVPPASTLPLTEAAVRPLEKEITPYFPFKRLPKKIKDRILSILLVNDRPILIDFTWLRPFISGHARVPSASKKLTMNGNAYRLPIEWNQLLKDVAVMQRDCGISYQALEDRGNKSRRINAPCRGVSTGVLRASKGLHEQAAPIFYSQNTFHFPSPTSAWMQLDSFLATIGPLNASHLRNIRIHAPLWYRGIHEDYLEAAILDLTSPASRFGVIKPAAKDRLLSAIQSCVHALTTASKLTNLSLDLELGTVADCWAGRDLNDRQLISMADAEEYVTRKDEGIKLLKQFAGILPQSPTIALFRVSTPKKTAKRDIAGFRIRLGSFTREAELYGWHVNQELQCSRW